MKITVIEQDKIFYPAVVTNDYHWILRWTGWKTRFEADTLAAQWMAYPISILGKSRNDRPNIDRPNIVSSSPGAVACVMRGDSFNLSWQSSQIYVGIQSDDATREKAKQQTFFRLLTFMKENIDPISDWSKVPWTSWSQIGWEPPF